MMKHGRRRLEQLEADLIALRRSVAAAITGGLDGNREDLEQAIGRAQASLTLMTEHGDVSPEACLEYAARRITMIEGRVKDA